MALNSGFERYEGAAYFGYDMDGEGYEAVVIVGQNLLEIRDLNDNPLSQWIPGTYSCNDQELPMRAYFHGGEWLAPQDEELREVLDRFIAPPPPSDEVIPSRGRRLLPLLWFLLVFAVLAVLAFFALRPLTNQLLSPAIRASLDEDVIANFDSDFEICNPALNRSSHDKIINTIDTPDFIVRPSVTQNYARLPSGNLLINAEFIQNLDNAETLAALLQLSQARNAQSDPAAELIARIPLVSRFKFLANAEVSREDVNNAWNEYAARQSFDPAQLRTLPEPKGDFQNLSLKLAWPEGEYPAKTSEIVLTDEEWLSLFTFCEKDA